MGRFEHRKATVKVQLKDAAGQPIKNTPIRAEQKTHKFLFGCGAFDTMGVVMPDDMPMFPGADPEMMKRMKASSIERMEKFIKLFNYGTIPFYWGGYERKEGEPNQKMTMAQAQWLKDHGITVKGHPLCWHTVCADWLMNYSNEEILKKQLARIHREVSAYKGLVDMWDVINEVVIMPVFDKYDNAITRICKEYGRFKLVKEVFEAAHADNPNATLLINDFNTSQSYEILVEGLLEMGVPISAIGIQSHQHQGYWGLEKLHTVLERFEHFGLPIHFTENTLISGEIMPAYIEDLNDWQVDEWPSTPEGLERQAREASEMYTELFAHPLVEAITTWDLTDGKWLKAPSGVLTVDNKEKPVYDALMGLIHGEWETKDTFVTDENGVATITGFKGEYDLTVNGKTVRVSVLEDSDAIVEKII
ncbi:MAG: endo-1,4-beta-xylanase [Lachnospiraceae bacterium]|nr:endo-1,4-beta-xylanase [Lachnospiraceae bacterium]